LRASLSSRRRRSSPAWTSASLTMRPISSSDRLEEPVIVMDCSRWVAMSLADTFRMPLVSMSKVTSTCGTPRGAGGMPEREKVPRFLLWAAISRSPWKTLTSTLGWLSDAVVKTWLRLVGIVVFRSMRRVNTPPRVSMPRESGVTSRSTTSFISPASTAPWIAAPTATTSSGFTLRLGSLDVSRSTNSAMAGIRVEPPTRMT